MQDIINRLEFVHSKSYLHRDLKPRRADQVYIIDFGLAKKYRDGSTHRHIPYKENRSFIGTPSYRKSPVAGTQTRKDFGKEGFYFRRRVVQWLSDSLHLTVVIAARLGLMITDKPDYAYLKRLFRELFIRQGFEFDYVFDWTGSSSSRRLVWGGSSSRELPFSGVISSIDVLRINEGGT
uniref:Protein kinase domain-containing protein n=1 Tax=Brassica oleracea var. oleracea TaxID=109376 RepID=A0A0D3EI53_BRAOL